VVLITPGTRNYQDPAVLMLPGHSSITKFQSDKRPVWLGSRSVSIGLVLLCLCFCFGSPCPALVCTCGALRWPSRCLQVAPLSSRMVTCTASKTPNVMHIFERVPDNVYVYAARRTAAWRTPTVAKFLRYLPLRLSPRERVGYRLHSGQHNVQPRPCPLHKYLFHQHMARSCAVLCLSTRGVRLR
jgi:hypothetical protein